MFKSIKAISTDLHNYQAIAKIGWGVGSKLIDFRYKDEKPKTTKKNKK